MFLHNSEDSNHKNSGNLQSIIFSLYHTAKPSVHTTAVNNIHHSKRYSNTVVDESLLALSRNKCIKLPVHHQL